MKTKVSFSFTTLGGLLLLEVTRTIRVSYMG